MNISESLSFGFAAVVLRELTLGLPFEVVNRRLLTLFCHEHLKCSSFHNMLRLVSLDKLLCDRVLDSQFVPIYTNSYKFGRLTSYKLSVFQLLQPSSFYQKLFARPTISFYFFAALFDCVMYQILVVLWLNPCQHVPKELSRRKFILLIIRKIL
jgi:hypothetical protein